MRRSQPQQESSHYDAYVASIGKEKVVLFGYAFYAYWWWCGTRLSTLVWRSTHVHSFCRYPLIVYIVHDIPSGRSLAFLWPVVCLFVGHSWVYSYHVSFCKISFRLTAGPNSIRLPTICESFSNCQKASAALVLGCIKLFVFRAAASWGAAAILEVAGLIVGFAQKSGICPVEMETKCSTVDCSWHSWTNPAQLMLRGSLAQMLPTMQRISVLPWDQK